MKTNETAANGLLPLPEVNQGLDAGKSRQALSTATSRIVRAMTPNGTAADAEDEWKAFTGKTGTDVPTEALHSDDRASAAEPDTAERVLGESQCRPARAESLPGPPAAQGLESGPVVFDNQDLVKRLGANQALARKVVQAFLEAAPSQLSNLRGQLTGRDVEAGSREAHTLKGAAATISAPALRSLALKAERAAQAGDWTTLGELLPRMEDQLERLRTAVAAWG